MLSTVAPLANGGSEVLVNADIDLVGKIVQFGRGMVTEVSRQMFRQFSTCVKTQLEVAEEPQSSDQPGLLGAHVALPGAAVPETTAAPEVKAVAAAPLAFRALWAIIVRFFKGLVGGGEKKQ
jgi:hypothetical protein